MWDPSLTINITFYNTRLQSYLFIIEMFGNFISIFEAFARALRNKNEWYRYSVLNIQLCYCIMRNEFSKSHVGACLHRLQYH